MAKKPAKIPVAQVLRSFQEFVRTEASGGVLLLLCAVVALLWANSAADSYTALWQMKVDRRVRQLRSF